MRITRTIILGEEEGSATVELSLLLALFLLLILFSSLFADLSIARSRALEGARHLAWEFTAPAHTNYLTGDTDSASGRLRALLPQELARRWGDDLDGATIASEEQASRGADGRSVRGLASIFQLQEGALSLSDSSSLALAPIEELAEYAGFNSKGLIAVELPLHSRAADVMLPWPLGALDTLMVDGGATARQRASLLVDAWNLPDGSDVDDAHESGCRGAYCAQVGRLALLGVGGFELSRESAELLSAVGLHSPLSPVVRSLALRRPDDDGTVRFEEENIGRLRPMHRHYTNVFKESFSSKQSLYRRAAAARGGNYLGCPESQRMEGECRWRE